VSIPRASWSVRRRLCVGLRAALDYLWDRLSISEQHLFYSLGSILGEVDHSKTHLEFHFEVRSLSSLDLLFRWFFTLLMVFSGGDDRG